MGIKMSKNLMETMEKNENKENNNSYFRPAGDLDLGEKKSFKAGDDKKSFLASIVSGKSYDDGDIIEAGRMILPFDEVVELYENGYNIISANYFNDLMVDVEFEKKHEKGRGR